MAYLCISGVALVMFFNVNVADMFSNGCELWPPPYLWPLSYTCPGPRNPHPPLWYPYCCCLQAV